VEVDDELVTRLRMAMVRMYRRLRQEDGPGATPSQMSALASLLRLGPLTLGELAAVERVRPPTMTRIVAALEEAGMVEREPDQRDRRVTRVRVSPAGDAFAAGTRARRNAFLAARLAELDQADLDALTSAVGVLERLAADAVTLPRSPVGRS
jgi:DNA-binding MarR family transcriptional regulator